ncbi:uncharacterized protein [Nicotiana tomentosiformis]|uniref:uncharacterized protein n=1 Tax=Nicotiana tomentosiformis TaxID=4098 RepID=UPI00388C4476
MLYLEAKRSLNMWWMLASVLHHKALFRSRRELSRYEAENRGLIEERDAFKLLSEQREGEAKGLWVELEVAQKEQADMSEQVKRIFEVNDTDSGVVANSSVPQVQRKLDVIGQLREEVDAVKAEAEAWKKNMDRLASEKEAARAQLASVETQLRSLKEKALVQVKKIEEFQSRFDSTTSDRERLATELATAKSEVETAKANADAMVPVYLSDTEAAQVRAKEVAEAAQARENWVNKGKAVRNNSCKMLVGMTKVIRIMSKKKKCNTSTITKGKGTTLKDQINNGDLKEIKEIGTIKTTKSIGVVVPTIKVIGTITIIKAIGTIKATKAIKVTTIKDIGEATTKGIGGQALKGPRCINNQTTRLLIHLKFLVPPTMKWDGLKICSNK